MSSIRRKYKRTLCITSGLLFPAFCVTLCAAKTIVTCNNDIVHKNPNLDEVIPFKYLELSEDGTVLNGFKSDVTKNDILYYGVLEIPDSVVEIAPFAFAHIFDGLSSNVSKIIIHDNLEVIGDGAFRECWGIQQINFRDIEETSKLREIKKEAFYQTGLIGELMFPKSIKHIGAYCFYNCDKLDSIIHIPSTIESVGQYAFAYCTGVRTLDFLDYTSIPDWLVGYNYIFKNLGSTPTTDSRQIRIHRSIADNDLLSDIFYNRQGISSSGTGSFTIVFTDTMPTDKLDIDEDKVLHGFKQDFDPFTELSQYSLIQIPDDVETIKASAFEGKILSENCHVSITLPSSLKKIEKKAFYGCTGLYEDINLPSSLETIGESSFDGCSNIGPNLQFGEQTILVDQRAFANCSSLLRVNFNGSMSIEEKQGMKIKDDAFKDCKRLSIIDLSAFGPSGFPQTWCPKKDVPKFFSGYSKTGMLYTDYGFSPTKEIMEKFEKFGLDNITDEGPWIIAHEPSSQLPFTDKHFNTSNRGQSLWGLSELGKNELTDFNQILLSTKVTEIKDSAFLAAFPPTQLEGQDYYWSLILPYGLKTIGTRAFQACSNIRCLLDIPETVVDIQDYAFASCTNLIGSLELPNKIKHIGSFAFVECNLLSSNCLYLPSELTSIDTMPFYGTSLYKIVINNKIHSFNNLVFDGISTLEELDFSHCSFYDTENWQYSDKSLSMITTTGTVYVSQAEDRILEWSDLLHNRMGLPSGWVVKGK